MLATGRLPLDTVPKKYLDLGYYLGIEFSGRLGSTGQRIMGAAMPALCLHCTSTLATSVVVAPNMFWQIPDYWTLEQAATVPVAYATAYYALVVRGQLRQTDKVLIHSGSGGVGQAAISVALACGCEVFTTVGSEAKKDFLKKKFPQLQEKHFASSRTQEFKKKFASATRQRGVDVVLNSLSEENFQASLRCLADGGRFLEIGKFDLLKNTKVGMGLFLNNITFHGIQLDTLEESDWIEVQALIQKGIASGVVQPLSFTVFEHQHVEEAFRYMARGQHVGKILIQVRSEESQKTVPSPLKISAMCRSLCHPLHTYLITGGLGGFGLELARWLVHRGARKLVLTSRSGIRTGYQARCVDFWDKEGVSVLISSLDVSNAEQTTKLINQCQDQGPLGGIFHLAMVHRNCLFKDQTAANFQEVAKAKYWGIKNLDQATRKMCGEELKWFVAFSSIVSGKGIEGQTNYGWANSAMERVVEQRRAHGYPGIAIQWGLVGDVGMFIEDLKGSNDTVIEGLLPQPINSCLQVLDQFLILNHPIVASYIWADKEEKIGFHEAANSFQAIMHIMGVNDESQLDFNTTLGEMGMNSLVGMEIKHTLEQQFNISLNVKEIKNLTLNDLKSMSENGCADAASDIPTHLMDEDKFMGDKMKHAESGKQQMQQFLRLQFDINVDLMVSESLVHLNEVKNGPPVFLVHSIEGVAAPLRSLAAKLTIPVFCFQCTPNAPADSIEELAESYIQEMKAEQPEGPYRIVGYSFGALIAFEMATQLQSGSDCMSSEHQIHSLVLLDASPYYAGLYNNAYLKYYEVSRDLQNDPIFETELLSSLGMNFLNLDYNTLKTDLWAQQNWRARVNKFVTLLMTTGVFHSAETLSWGCDALRQKFLALHRYDPKNIFNGDITLVRTASVQEDDFDGWDYGLGKICSGTVHVELVEGDHIAVVQGPTSEKTAKIIMKKALK